MEIPSSYLEAFYEIARKQSFSAAAESLFVTQSAVSQRLNKLEELLEKTLILRDNKSLSLTEEGEILFRYCQNQKELEEELLAKLLAKNQKYPGSLRIGAYSSVLRSVVLPSLSPFIRENENLDIQFLQYPPYLLETALQKGEIDIAIADFHFLKNNIEEIKLGEEEFVIIESKKHKLHKDTFLDHGPKDAATKDYFHLQGKKDESYRRNFMGDVYGIVEGVKQGLGKAVMSKHLVKNDSELRIKKSEVPYFRPVVCHFFKKPYQSRLFEESIDRLTKNAKKFL